MSISVLSRTRSFFSVMAVIVFSAMALVGCGGDDGSGDEDGPGGSSGITEADVTSKFVLGAGEAWIDSAEVEDFRGNSMGWRGVVFLNEQTRQEGQTNPKYKRLVTLTSSDNVTWTFCAESNWYIDEGALRTMQNECNVSFYDKIYELSGDKLKFKYDDGSVKRSYTKKAVGALWEP